MAKTKAIGLFSGGLDSLLAIKLIQKQGIDVTAVSFRSPFFVSNEEKKKKLEQAAISNNFSIHFIDIAKDYLKILRNPKHGYGKNINPCIDCHAFMVKKAAQYAKKIGAKFVFTGEVLDERPMSQTKKSLKIVEKESVSEGKLLRPLSAQLLEETEAEKKGFVDRNKLLALRGKDRNPQFLLAKELGIKNYESPGGGCLLTNKEYSAKVKDLLKNTKNIKLNDLYILKVGRHFRLGKNKIIVGRNKNDNEQLLKLKHNPDLIFEAKDYMGPVTILQGPKKKDAIILAASLTARYSDADKEEVSVKYGKGKLNKNIKINKSKEEQINKLRI